MEFTLFLLIVIGVIQILLVWSIFNMRNHIEKQSAIMISMVRLLAKIANNTGSDAAETKEVLEKLSSKL